MFLRKQKTLSSNNMYVIKILDYDKWFNSKIRNAS
jgi:hypothetical protein